ncbi:MAG: cation:proton antiporter [Gammaproteobacteria bacterium]|nr:MAG: potassium transporter KefB [Gammaproteobacteria bacterium]UCH40224.1 MAG: cation:proton antiporter [Gammaproteobacteria bacterium]
MLNEVLILLFFSVVSVAIFRRMDIPAVLGYLLVGLVAGDHALGLIHRSHAMEQIAEIGVVFLLFTLGLEVSIPRLIAMRNIVFGIGVIQVIVSTCSTILLGMWFGLSWQASFAVGGALAMSSTAIVVKLLTEQYELHLPHGNISLGVLLFQDLAVVPFLVLIPIFADPGADSLLLPISLALAKGAFAFALIFFAGQYLIRPAIRKVAATHSSELFTLFILLIALLAAWLTWQLGLSLAMGAFLAGIMLAETEYQHHVENEIRPFRDVLMGLFFISVGSQFDWLVIIDEPLEVVVLTLGLIAGKGIAIMLITRLAGYSSGVAIRAGILLGQGSEFGFALLAVTITSGLLSLELSQPIIAAIILSMAISPMLIRHNEAIACRFAPGYAGAIKQHETGLEEACRDLRGHVLLCGFGRTAQNLAQFLKREAIPFVALELDTEIVREAREAGEPVFFGDSSHAEILRLAGIERARVLVVSFIEIEAAEHIARNTRELCPEIPLLIRTRDDRHLERLLECGADEVIPDTVESSMMLARHTLAALGEDPQSIEAMLDEARQGHYARIRAFFHSLEDVDLQTPDHHHLHSIEMLGSYHAIGRRIDSLKCLQTINVIGLRRNGVTSEDPLHEVKFKPGDVLIIEGHPDDIQAAEIEVMSGL